MTPSAGRCWRSTGRTSAATTMCGRFHRHLWRTGMSMSSAEGSPVNRHQPPLPFTVVGSDWREQIAASGTKCCESCDWSGLAGWLSRTWPEREPGERKSREVWRLLATAFPANRCVCRLRVLVLLIDAGVCSGLPTVTSRDWRSPGSPNHPRLNASRGEPLTETLGCRLSPALCEWMMGFPAGWTDVTVSTPSVTPSCPVSPRRLGDSSLGA